MPTGIYIRKKYARRKIHNLGYIHIDKKKLEDLCINRNLSAGKCAKILNISRRTVTRRLTEFNVPKKAPSHRKDRKQKSSGYILISKPSHPNASKKGYVLEHVFVMSERLGRPLTKKETVHHKNGIRNDNEPENLELWVSNHPGGQRVKDKIEWAIEFLKEYYPSAINSKATKQLYLPY